MKTVWDRIHVWLAANAPVVLATLRPGASEDEIRAAEREMGVALPEDVKACYRIHDGQEGRVPPGFLYGWGLLPLARVRKWQRTLVRLVEGGDFDGLKGAPMGPVRDDWYHPAWIPITSNTLGDAFCLDLAPAPGGDVGQVIIWYHDYTNRGVTERSFALWLAHFADELESGRWSYSEDEYGLRDVFAGG
jgi:cell wall assembly regulator SMI1